MCKQIQNYINFLIAFLIASNICFTQGEGCIDPNAYNCQGSMAGEYITDIGGIVYDFTCNGTTPAGDENCSNNEICQGYYDPAATVDNGSCRYYQAPHGNDVSLTLTSNGIAGDWQGFTIPTNAVLESYHVQRCTDAGCVWLDGFTPSDANPAPFFNDEYNYEIGVEIKYAIAVKYSNNPYWGWAIGASYITPQCPNMGDMNSDNTWNVLDIVALANCVLGNNCEDIPNSCAADMNGDGGYNVLDIVALANCVLAQNCG